MQANLPQREYEETINSFYLFFWPEKITSNYLVVRFLVINKKLSPAIPPPPPPPPPPHLFPPPAPPPTL